jgi:hypothetical protein
MAGGTGNKMPKAKQPTAKSSRAPLAEPAEAPILRRSSRLSKHTTNSSPEQAAALPTERIAKTPAAHKRKRDGSAGLKSGEDVDGQHKKAHTAGNKESKLVSDGEFDSDDELDQIIGDLSDLQSHGKKAHTTDDEMSNAYTDDGLELRDFSDLDETKPSKKRGWYGKQSDTSATPPLTDKTIVERRAGPRTVPTANGDSDQAAGGTKKTGAPPAAGPSTEMVLYNANLQPGSSTPQAPWYELPYELQCQILEYVLHIRVPIYPPNCFVHNQRMILRAGLVNRDINKMATEIFYKQNHFVAKVARPWGSAKDLIFPKCFMSPNASVGPLVRRLKVELCVDFDATTVQDMILGRSVDHTHKYRGIPSEWRHLLGWECKIAEETILKMEKDRVKAHEDRIAYSKYGGYDWKGKTSDNPRKYWDHGCTKWQETFINLTSLTILLRADHSAECTRCHPRPTLAGNRKAEVNSFPERLEDGVIALRAHQVEVIVEGVECKPECGEFARGVERTIRGMIQAPEPDEESKD